jgi:excisionase family DNA binding protein
MSTLTVETAAERMGVSTKTVWGLISNGTIPAAKIGRAYIMLERDVMAYIEAQIVKQTAERMGMEAGPIRRPRRRATSP